MGRGIDRLGAFTAETDQGQVRRTVGEAFRIAEHEPGAGILHDEMDSLARKLEIHRHRDEAGAHDAVIRREILGAVGRKDRDPLAALEATGEQGARDAVRHLVERAVADLARRLLAAEIDDRDLVEIAVAADQVTEVLEVGHWPEDTRNLLRLLPPPFLRTARPAVGPLAPHYPPPPHPPPPPPPPR